MRKLIVAAIVSSFGSNKHETSANIAVVGRELQHTAQVLAEFGYDPDEIAALEQGFDIASGGSGTVTVGEPIDLGGIRVTVGGYTVAESTLRFDTAQGSLGTSALGTSGSNVFTLNSALTGSGELAIASHGNLSDDVPAFYCRGRSRRRAGGNGAGEREVGRIQRSEVRERVERFGMVEIEKVESTQTGEAR